MANICLNCKKTIGLVSGSNEIIADSGRIFCDTCYREIRVPINILRYCDSADENAKSYQNAVNAVKNCSIHSSLHSQILADIECIYQTNVAKYGKETPKIQKDLEPEKDKSASKAKETSIMFGNIGGRIKRLAVVLCWIGIIISVVIAIALWTQNSRYNSTIGLGFGILIGGCVASWISSFAAYAFGVITENSERQTALLTQLCKEQQKMNEYLSQMQTMTIPDTAVCVESDSSSDHDRDFADIDASARRYKRIRSE